MPQHLIIIDKEVIPHLAASYLEHYPEIDEMLEIRCMTAIVKTLNIPKVIDMETRADIYQHYTDELVQTIVNS